MDMKETGVAFLWSMSVSERKSVLLYGSSYSGWPCTEARGGGDDIHKLTVLYTSNNPT